MNIKFNFSNLSLILIIGIISTVTLFEDLQTADGLSGVALPVEFNLQLGENAVQTWELINTGNEKIWVEFYSSGEGNDLLIFEKVISLEPHSSKIHEFIVSIPEDHPNNITYKNAKGRYQEYGSTTFLIR